MFVVCVLCNIFIASTARLGCLPCWRSQPMGCIPHYAIRSIPSGFGAQVVQALSVEPIGSDIPQEVATMRLVDLDVVRRKSSPPADQLR